MQKTNRIPEEEIKAIVKAINNMPWWERSKARAIVARYQREKRIEIERKTGKPVKVLISVFNYPVAQEEARRRGIPAGAWKWIPIHDEEERKKALKQMWVPNDKFLIGHFKLEEIKAAIWK